MNLPTTCGRRQTGCSKAQAEKRFTAVARLVFVGGEGPAERV